MGELSANALWAVQDRLELVREQRDGLEGTARLDDIDVIDELLDRVERRIEEAQLTIAVLGDTNAGKSTLLNAVIEAPILPVSGVGVGTAAPTRLEYRPGPGYRAEIELLSLAELQRDCFTLLQHQQASVEPDLDLDFADSLTTIEHRLESVFGDGLARFLQSGRLDELRPVPAAASLLAAGRQLLEGGTPASIAEQLSQFLSASSSTARLVKSATVTGPFEVLTTGAAIEDLPGLNDPDAVRSAMTAAAVQRAQLVLVVVPIDVGLGRSLLHGMSTMIADLLVDGGSDRLVFVVTKLDHIGVSDARNVGAPLDATRDEVLSHSKSAAERQIRDRIDFLTRPLRYRLHQGAEAAIDAVRSSPIRFVSAHAHLRRVHPAAYPSGPLGDDGILALQETIGRLGREHVSPEELAAIEEELDGIAALVRGVITGRGAALHRRSRTAGALVAFDQQAEAAIGMFRDDLDTIASNFRHAIETASAPSLQSLEGVLAKWHGLTPKTLRAVMMNYGQFTGQGGVRHDFNADLAEHFFLAVFEPWDDLFERQLPSLVRSLQVHLNGALAAAVAPARPPRTSAVLVGRVTKLLRAERPAMRAGVVEAVKARLAGDYERLARHHGVGMKTRILDGLAEAAGARRADLRHVAIEQSMTWLDALNEEIVDLATDEVASEANKAMKLLITLD